MEYITAAEAAGKWGITSRQVQRLLADNRIPDAKRYGRTFAVPADAKKPDVMRFGKKSASQSFASELNHAIDVIYNTSCASGLRENPDRILDMIKEENLRLTPESTLAYLRGDFERVKQCFKKIGENDAAKLCASPTAIAAAICSGDYPFYQGVETYLKNIIKADFGADVTAYAEHALAIGYLGATAPDMVTEWIKKGEYANLHPMVRYEAAYQRVQYLQYMKKYESMLDVAQTALSLLPNPSGKGLTITEIMLRIRCAIACHHIDREGEAQTWLLGAMYAALPHGFIISFADTIMLLGGLTERCLKQAYPKYYNVITELADRVIKNWISFHNRFVKDNVPLILTMQEGEIITIASRGVPYKEIAERYNITVGTLKNKMRIIFEKLCISKKSELADFVPYCKNK